jgi:hypothetical protein
MKSTRPGGGLVALFQQAPFEKVIKEIKAN